MLFSFFMIIIITMNINNPSYYNMYHAYEYFTEDEYKQRVQKICDQLKINCDGGDQTSCNSYQNACVEKPKEPEPKIETPVPSVTQVTPPEETKIETPVTPVIPVTPVMPSEPNACPKPPPCPKQKECPPTVIESTKSMHPTIDQCNNIYGSWFARMINSENFNLWLIIIGLFILWIMIAYVGKKYINIELGDNKLSYCDKSVGRILNKYKEPIMSFYDGMNMELYDAYRGTPMGYADHNPYKVGMINSRFRKLYKHDIESPTRQKNRTIRYHTKLWYEPLSYDEPLTNINTMNRDDIIDVIFSKQKGKVMEKSQSQSQSQKLIKKRVQLSGTQPRHTRGLTISESGTLQSSLGHGSIEEEEPEEEEPEQAGAPVTMYSVYDEPMTHEEETTMASATQHEPSQSLTIHNEPTPPSPNIPNIFGTEESQSSSE